MTSTLIRRTALLSLLLPFLYLGTASATFLFRLHAENSAPAHVRLVLSPAPAPAQRILIFSPHPDDETLGCAGMLQQAVHAGAAVRIVMLTNGDGFRVAVERQFRTLRVGKEDYVRFAAIRQEEVYRALGNLGVRRDDVTFLGYPDRGLMPLWNDCWTPDRAFVSPYTGTNRSPYDRAYHKDTVYCGQNLLADIEEILRAERPTDIYVTHPSDDHPDHGAASAFVTLALNQLRESGMAWARDSHLHYFLVHRGDWPLPQGLQKSEPLVPPSEMLALDTRWSQRPLTDSQVDRKTGSILAYSSQTSVMKRFLVSFARRNELIGDMSAIQVPRVPDNAIALDGSIAEWKRLSPAILDPVNDNLLRDFQAGGDIQTVYAARDGSNLYLRVDTSRPAPDNVEFRVRIRYFGDASRQEAGGSFTATIQPPSAASPPNLRAVIHGPHLELAIPLRELNHAHYLALNVETSFAGLQVDRTGYRFLTL